MAFKLKKRCWVCAHILRENGTCENPKCPKYVAEGAKESVDTTNTDTTTSKSSQV